MLGKIISAALFLTCTVGDLCAAVLYYMRCSHFQFRVCRLEVWVTVGSEPTTERHRLTHSLITSPCSALLRRATWRMLTGVCVGACCLHVYNVYFCVYICALLLHSPATVEVFRMVGWPVLPSTCLLKVQTIYATPNPRCNINLRAFLQSLFLGFFYFTCMHAIVKGTESDV